MNETLERIDIESEVSKDTENVELNLEDCDFLLDGHGLGTATSPSDDSAAEIYDLDQALRELEIIDNIATHHLDTESDSMDTRSEEDRLRIEELEAEVALLKAELGNAAWVPATEDDYKVVRDVQTTANKVPCLFSDAAKRGYLPLCNKERASILKIHESAKKNLIYLDNLNKNL